jgi:outer membrane receptor protein involved in Fe transport
MNERSIRYQASIRCIRHFSLFTGPLISSTNSSFFSANTLNKAISANTIEAGWAFSLKLDGHFLEELLLHAFLD